MFNSILKKIVSDILSLLWRMSHIFSIIKCLPPYVNVFLFPVGIYGGNHYIFRRYPCLPRHDVLDLGEAGIVDL